MNTTFDVLVIVLSVLLGLFLIVSVLIALLVYKVVKTVHRIATTAEQMVTSAEAAAEMFKNAAAPAGVMRSLVNIVETVTNYQRKGAKK